MPSAIIKTQTEDCRAQKGTSGDKWASDRKWTLPPPSRPVTVCKLLSDVCFCGHTRLADPTASRYMDPCD